MIHPKEFQFQEMAAASSSGRSSSAAETSSGSSSDSVLSSLFRARMHSGPLSSNHDDDKPQQQRVAPLVSSMAPPSMFRMDSSLPKAAAFQSSGHLPATSLFHLQSHSLVHNHNAPFPLHSELFNTATSTAFPMSSTNARPNQQEELDQSLRSLSSALMISRQATASMTTPTPIMNMRINHGTTTIKRRPLRNQATRVRLVGQVLGQKGVQKLLTVVKELKKVQPSSSILVDAWEQTPLNDMKTLPWEDMLRDAQISLEVYHASHTK